MRAGRPWSSSVFFPAGVLFRISYWYIYILEKLIPHDSSDYSIQAVEAHMSTLYKVSVVPSPRSNILIELALEWQLKGRLFQEKQAKKASKNPCFLAKTNKKTLEISTNFDPSKVGLHESSLNFYPRVFKLFLALSLGSLKKNFWSMSNFEMSSSFFKVLPSRTEWKRWMVKTTDFGATFHGVAGASTRCRRGKLIWHLWLIWFESLRNLGSFERKQNRKGYLKLMVFEFIKWS